MIVEALKKREEELRGAEKRGFERGAEAMRRACMTPFNRRAEELRLQQRSVPAQGWDIAQDLRLSAEIADQEHAAYLLSKLPVPVFDSEHTKEGH